MVVDWYDFMNYTKIRMSHYQYDFLVKDGQFIEYTAVEYDGDKVKESPWGKQTYQVTVDRKID